MLRAGHATALAAGHRPGAFVGDVALDAAAEEPERDVDALDLLDMVLRGKGLGQKGLFLVMLFEAMTAFALLRRQSTPAVSCRPPSLPVCPATVMMAVNLDLRAEFVDRWRSDPPRSVSFFRRSGSVNCDSTPAC